MIHNLSKIFMDYGDSNWTIGVLIGLFIFITGVILWAIGGITDVTLWIIGKAKKFPDHESLIIFGMIIIIIGVLFTIFPEIGCIVDEEQQVRTAIRNEYENVSFTKQNKTFTSNDITYIYEIKDRKITVHPLDDANVKIIE